MTREEAIKILEKEKIYMLNHGGDMQANALSMAIKSLEQDVVPFDFDLYQAGLMDMPKEMIKVLDKIRAEIEEHAKINQNLNTDRARALCWCLDVIDKYKAEMEIPLNDFIKSR